MAGANFGDNRLGLGGDVCCRIEATTGSQQVGRKVGSTLWGELGLGALEGWCIGRLVGWEEVTMNVQLVTKILEGWCVPDVAWLVVQRSPRLSVAKE